MEEKLKLLEELYDLTLRQQKAINLGLIPRFMRLLDQREEVIKKIESCDLLIAPIADNKMFDILNQFAEGLINTKQAIHCLSASRLGKQYVIISDKALNRLKPIERLYLCKEEKEKSKSDSFERSLLIQSKLDFAKRNFRNEGEYIDEVLK